MSEYVKTITSIAIHSKNSDAFTSDDVIKISFADAKNKFNVVINGIELSLTYEQSVEIVKTMKTLTEQKGIASE